VTVGVCSSGQLAVPTLGDRFFFGNTELSLELWATIAGMLGFDD
jgi:hypothetical protein